MRISTTFLALAFCAVNAGCGGDSAAEAATQDVDATELQWEVVDPTIPDVPTRLASGDEWAAQCEMPGAATWQSPCTDSPVEAQRWAEAAQDVAHDGLFVAPGVDIEVWCTSVQADVCTLPSDE